MFFFLFFLLADLYPCAKFHSPMVSFFFYTWCQMFIGSKNFNYILKNDCVFSGVSITWRPFTAKYQKQQRNVLVYVNNFSMNITTASQIHSCAERNVFAKSIFSMLHTRSSPKKINIRSVVVTVMYSTLQFCNQEFV